MHSTGRHGGQEDLKSLKLYKLRNQPYFEDPETGGILVDQKSLRIWNHENGRSPAVRKARVLLGYAINTSMNKILPCFLILLSGCLGGGLHRFCFNNETFCFRYTENDTYFEKVYALDPLTSECKAYYPYEIPYGWVKLGNESYSCLSYSLPVVVLDCSENETRVKCSQTQDGVCPIGCEFEDYDCCIKAGYHWYGEHGCYRKELDPGCSFSMNCSVISDSCCPPWCHANVDQDCCAEAGNYWYNKSGLGVGCYAEQPTVCSGARDGFCPKYCTYTNDYDCCAKTGKTWTAQGCY
jgi:hypothetical protein